MKALTKGIKQLADETIAAFKGATDPRVWHYAYARYDQCLEATLKSAGLAGATARDREALNRAIRRHDGRVLRAKPFDGAADPGVIFIFRD